IGVGLPVPFISAAAREFLCAVSKIIRPLSSRTGYKRHSSDSKIVFLGSIISIVLLFRLCCLASRAPPFVAIFDFVSFPPGPTGPFTDHGPHTTARQLKPTVSWTHLYTLICIISYEHINNPLISFPHFTKTPN